MYKEGPNKPTCVVESLASSVSWRHNWVLLLQLLPTMGHNAGFKALVKSNPENWLCCNKCKWLWELNF
ncbi:unnamed protein product [Prunus armeniaca]|uniref:Uncharacterized protein n=1 Tax=Prunus armeniaca TaxID=36596 RepID=A0A6J5XMB6_PRUAR|nr:unnamed protein product [Prunus armeniaca]